jgi:hypothetical protein
MTDDDMTDEPVEQDQDDRPSDAGRRPLGGFAAGVLFGAVLGVGLALLFAPERGETMRRRLRRRLARLREDAEDGLERAGNRTRRELARRRRQVEAGLERARDRS